MLRVRVPGGEEPTRRNLGRFCGDPAAGTREDVALAALRLDDLLDVEHGALVRSDGRPRRQNAPDLVRTLAGNVAIAGVGCQHESVDDPGIAAVRDFDVGESRIEGQLVASLAVVPERDG